MLLNEYFQAEVENKYRDLQDLLLIRRKRLTENKEWYEYIREVEDVCQWIKEQEVIAASEDYGTDLDHVQVRTPGNLFGGLYMKVSSSSADYAEEI